MYTDGRIMRILLTQFTSSPIALAHLANALSKKHEVIVLIAERLYDDKYFDKSIDISLISSPKSYYKMFLKTLNPASYRSIIKKIAEVSPDVVHITWDFLWYNILSPSLKKYPLVLTDEEPFLKVLTLYGKTIYKIFKPHSWRMADAIVVHGEKEREFLIKKGIPESNVYVIPIGVYSFYAKWAKNINEENSVLLFGAIEEYKGLEYLIKSAPIIISSVPDAKIIVAGRGKAYQKYEDYLHMDYFEVHRRYILDEEVATLFQRCAIVILPYTQLCSTSGVIPVAFAFGKPVVATDVGSLAEPIEEGKTGFVIPPRDERALADAIIKLLKNNGLREEMRRNIKRKVENELSWESIAAKVVQVYESVRKQ